MELIARGNGFLMFSLGGWGGVECHDAVVVVIMMLLTFKEIMDSLAVIFINVWPWPQAV